MQGKVKQIVGSTLKDLPDSGRWGGAGVCAAGFGTTRPCRAADRTASKSVADYTTPTHKHTLALPLALPHAL